MRTTTATIESPIRISNTILQPDVPPRITTNKNPISDAASKAFFGQFRGKDRETSRQHGGPRADFPCSLQHTVGSSLARWTTLRHRLETIWCGNP